MNQDSFPTHSSDGGPFSRRLLVRFVLCGWALASTASAQQTVTLQPLMPKIVTGANITHTNTYTLPIAVVFAGGNAAVNLAALGLPTGATASFNTNSITNSQTINLLVNVAGIAKGVYPVTIDASGGASASANMDLIAGQLWSATNLANVNWSVAANWSSGLVTTAGDHVKFEEADVRTNIVDTSVTIDSLTYASFVSGSNHTTVIPAGNTLSVVGAGGFSASVESVVGNNKTTTINITGGGTLVVSNEAANFAVNALNTGGSGTTLDMSGLSNFTATVSRFGVGDVTLAQAGSVGAQLVAVSLARTNVIRAGFAEPYTGQRITNSIQVFHNGQDFNNGSANTLNLGVVNQFFADSFTAARARVGSANNTVRFNPSFLADSPSAVFRNTNGGRMRLFGLAIDDGENAPGSNTRITGNFNGGALDLLAEEIWIGRNRFTNTSAARAEGVMTFNSGVVDVNTLRLGYQAYTNDMNARGILRVGGPGVLVVNDELELGHTSGDYIAGSAAMGFGQITITNHGVARVNQITVGQLSGANFVRLNSGGNLILSNSIASTAKPLGELGMSDAALTVHLTSGNTNAFVTDLVCGGLQNLINVASVTGVSSYPARIAVISYQAAPALPNIAMGSLPSGLFGFVENNTADKTIDVVINTNAPKTVIWRGNVNGNWDTATANWMDASTLAATTFADGDFVVMDDTASGATTVTLVGTVLPAQSPTIPGILISNTTLNYTLNGAGKIVGAARTVKQGAGTVTMNADTESPILVSAGTLNGNGNIGAVTVATNATLTFSGGISGPVVAGGTASSSGTVAGSLAVQSGGVFVNAGTLSGALSLQANATLTNTASGIMNVAAAWTIPTGARVVNLGTIVQAGRLDVGGILQGTGLFEAASGVSGDNSRVAVNSGGTFSPGNGGIGTLTMNTRFDMNAGSTNIFEVDLTAGTKDVAAADTINFGGQIMIVNIGTTPFASGQSFQILQPNFPPNIPNNANVSPFIPSVPGPGMVWLTNTAPNILRTNGFVGVLQITSGTPTNITFSLAGDVSTLSWPASHTGWRLQAQTNEPGVGITTNWFTVAGSTTNNLVNLTNNPAMGSSFFRLVYP